MSTTQQINIISFPTVIKFLLEKFDMYDRSSLGSQVDFETIMDTCGIAYNNTYVLIDKLPINSSCTSDELPVRIGTSSTSEALPEQNNSATPPYGDSEPEAQKEAEPKKTAKTVIEPKKSGKTVIEPKKTGKTVIEPKKTGKTVIEPKKTAKTVIEPKKSGKTVIEPKKTGKTVIEPKKTGKTVIEPKNSAKKVAEPKKRSTQESEPTQIMPEKVLNFLPGPSGKRVNRFVSTSGVSGKKVLAYLHQLEHEHNITFDINTIDKEFESDDPESWAKYCIKKSYTPDTDCSGDVIDDASSDSDDSSSVIDDSSSVSDDASSVSDDASSVIDDSSSVSDDASSVIDDSSSVIDDEEEIYTCEPINSSKFPDLVYIPTLEEKKGWFAVYSRKDGVVEPSGLYHIKTRRYQDLSGKMWNISKE
jgi:hypothetical protein